MLAKRNAAEQCAAYLRDRILCGNLVGKLPGVCALSRSLGVSRETARDALRMLEMDGLAMARGRGRTREVVSRGSGISGGKPTVAIFPRDPVHAESGVGLTVYQKMSGRIEEMGCRCVLTTEQLALGEDRGRLRKLVADVGADMWVLISASDWIRNYFVSEGIPAFGMGVVGPEGRMPGVRRDSAGFFGPVFREIFAMGHRRVTMLCHKERRTNSTGVTIPLYRQELALAGIPYGPYHLPDWEETPEGLQRILDALFRVTPPTFIQIVSPEWVTGVLGFLSSRGLRIPGDVSILCEVLDPCLAWYRPALAHFRLDIDAIADRVGQWVESVISGRKDTEVTLIGTDFIRGESIGYPTGR